MLSGQPAIISATLDFYDLLEKNAENEEISGHEVRIFRGPITKAYNSLGYSNSYYSRVRKNLIESGAVSILEQGAAGRPSVVALIRRPDPSELSAQRDLTTRVNPAILRGEVEAIKRNIGGMNIAEAFGNLEARLKSLEERVGNVEGKTKRRGKDG